ncbi:MAG: DUF4321 domain-containing protein [candidate division Zixibacteria bacterium]|nr:DUF4321 domain-containing protein [candidate division Zixibacteria bacterium]
MKKRELTFIIVALLLGAIIGGFLGELIGSYLPPGAAKTLFSRSVTIGFETTRVELYSISLTFGMSFKINFMSALLVLLVIVYFRWWYI